MKIKDLKEALASYEDDLHVVVAVIPANDSTFIVQKTGCKLEIHDVWQDGFGVLNVIATVESNTVDEALRGENDL